MRKAKKYLHRIGALLLSVTTLVSLLGFAGTPIEAKESTTEEEVEEIDSIPGYTVYIDSENNVCIETYDRERSGSIYYRTIGFSITRCAPGEARPINGVDSEWVDLDLKDSYQTTRPAECKGVSYRHNIFRIPMEDVIAQIRRAG